MTDEEGCAINIKNISQNSTEALENIVREVFYHYKVFFFRLAMRKMINFIEGGTLKYGASCMFLHSLI